MRAFSKGFDAYFERGKANGHPLPPLQDLGAERRPQDPRDSASIIVADDGKLGRERFDLVVLSVGMEQPASAAALAQAAGIELDEWGFCQTQPFHPVETSRPGVYVCGAFAEPKDIPDSVIEAGGAAAAALATIGQATGHAGRASRVPARDRGQAGGRAAHRRVHLQLRQQHRRRGGRGRRDRVRRDAAQRGPRREHDVHLLRRLAEADPGAHRRARPEPGHRLVLHAAHPRADLPRHDPRGGAEPLPVRDGQHPRPGLVGPRPVARAGDAKGPGPDAHGRGPLAALAAALHAGAEPVPQRAGHRRRRGGHDGGPQPGRAGLRRDPGRARAGAGRPGPQPVAHRRRWRRAGIPVAT